MECTVNWTRTREATKSSMTFQVDSGHTLVMDGAPDAAKPENGGASPRPMETVLAGTGGCCEPYDGAYPQARTSRCTWLLCQLTSERAEVDPKGIQQNSHALHGDGQIYC
jgi:putative redox protein